MDLIWKIENKCKEQSFVFKKKEKEKEMKPEQIEIKQV